MVSQIQSKPTCYGRSSALLPSHWELALVHSLEEWAADEGFGEIDISKAENLISYVRPQTTLDRNSPQYFQFLAEHQARMKRRYNGLARRLHFKYDPVKDCFVKKLEECGREDSNLRKH